MKTLILGSYGNNNVGEEAVLMGILNKIGKKDITVVSEKPLLVRGIHGVESLTLPMVEMENYDKLIVGGCGIFYGDPRRFTYRMIEANKMGIPVEVLNVEVGPIYNEAFEETKYAFSIADKISVRTSFSKVILHGIMEIETEIKVEKDISCSLQTPSCKELLINFYGEGPYLGVSLKNLKIYLVNLIKEIKEYLHQGYTVVPIFNAWSEDPDRLDMLGLNKVERLMRRSFNRWTSPLLPPLITMGVVKEMDKVISETVHSTLWSDHYGIETTSLVPQNNFHPMAFKELGAKKLIYSTPPNFIEENSLFLTYRGLDWSRMEEYKNEELPLG